MASSAPLPKRRCVLVCQYRSCARNGSAEVLAALRAAVPNNIFVNGSDCMGQCASGPTVRVMPDQTWYCRIKSSHIPEIVQQHLYEDHPVESLLHPRFHPRPDAYSHID
jgi:(2Fe-2S) ferredoxin